MHSRYRKFHSIEEASAWGKEHFGIWLDKYRRRNGWDPEIMIDPEYTEERFAADREEKEAFDRYCGYEAEKVNRRLRCEKISSGWDFRITDSLFYRITDTMDRVIRQYRVPENIIVYRYVNADDLRKAYGLLLPGRSICDKGFLSTGLCREALASIHEADEEHKKGYNMLLKIYVPKGTMGLYVTLVCGRPAEQEMIFPRGTRLRIMSIHRRGYLKIVNCKIINQQPASL